LLLRFPAFALLAIAIASCAGREPARNSEKVFCVSEQAQVGSRVRVQDGFVAPEYAPHYIVTRIHGRTRHCERSERLPITARGLPEEKQ